jgi:hypothetical protein
MKLFLLFLAFCPTICWITGAIGMVFFRNSTLATFFFLGLFPIGFLILKLTVLIQKSFYVHIKNGVGNVPDDDWIPAELEKLGTEDKLHVFPDELAIIYKKNGKVCIASQTRELISFNPGDALIIATIRKLSLSCSIVKKSDKTPLFDYSFSPKYSGKDLEFAGYPQKKIAWFSDWLGVEWTRKN